MTTAPIVKPLCSIGLAVVVAAFVVPIDASAQAQAPAPRTVQAPVRKPQPQPATQAQAAATPAPAAPVAAAPKAATVPENVVARVGDTNISADDLRSYVAALAPREQAALA